MEDKRYQVFLSSTYADLTEERAAVIQAILDFGHLPAGMEMFPAADEDQMTLIRQVIDQSDYYIVVVAGRYGSVSAQGISYTEQEYDYAVEQGIPILGFVHGDPDKIEQGKTDQSDEARRKLADFRAKVEQRMVKHFKNAAELRGHVMSSLARAFRTNPRTGWVRADLAMTVDTQREIIDLREQLARAKADRDVAQHALVEDTAGLEHGDDFFVIPVRITGRTVEDNKWKSWYLDASAVTTWDDLFSDIGPIMIDEAAEKDVRERAMRHAFSLVDEKDIEKTKYWKDRDASIYNDGWDMIVVQLRALGLIDKGQKKRAMTNTTKYLVLTEKGDRHLMFLRARKRGGDATSAVDETNSDADSAEMPDKPND
ncbi:DUF4062 domain-containing protein [Mycobacteroides abscessus]|uniref:DUF4062 domain-containing protein n=1 Tax=Mycobacteroides abscessus TaxID=36809 RepID=UPI00092B7D24|nr:DUF4062 domain-containing protein [Mycobacteroides abscessus]SHP56481.1 Uncharacterised protein [Mycobacteroides abscessus subsp. bolletii]SHS27442.1 Uncharacterised protein [Mycobacteroides abscessus subsp. bolletii]SHS78447.1 Uncharacterised protein [Mycobacteroides abscessus subsp. bolletii]SKF64921.1 Uncharacterised protein [Mycobacteroides abscessus subsp. bolletii]SKG37673.1 Uncharacterised protein [Mycobacteroides abscessus subsp. bolletii]